MSLETPSIDGCLRKIYRAEEHLAEIRRSVDDFLATDPYSVEGCFFADRDLTSRLGPAIGFGKLAYLALVFREHAPIPSVLSPQIGDCVRNLRSALDHLVCELAGRAADPSTRFPICLHRDDFEHPRILQNLQGFNEHAIELLRALQPFQRPEPERTDHPLWLLHRLEDIDRRRIFRLGASVGFDPRSDEVRISDGTMGPVEIIRRGALEHGDPFVRMLVRSSPLRHVFRRPRPTEVTSEVRIASPFELVFDDEDLVGNRPLIPTLEGLVAHVRDRVAPGFRPFFV